MITPSNVEPYFYNISVTHFVVTPLDLQDAVVTAVRVRVAVRRVVVVTHDLRSDKAPREIAVYRAGRVDRIVAFAKGPRPDFVWPAGKKADEA
jgi:hypothetical protein